MPTLTEAAAIIDAEADDREHVTTDQTFIDGMRRAADLLRMRGQLEADREA